MLSNMKTGKELLNPYPVIFSALSKANNQSSYRLILEMILNLDYLFVHLSNNYNNKYKSRHSLCKTLEDQYRQNNLSSSDNIKYSMDQMTY